MACTSFMIMVLCRVMSRAARAQYSIKRLHKLGKGDVYEISHAHVRVCMRVYACVCVYKLYHDFISKPAGSLQSKQAEVCEAIVQVIHTHLCMIGAGGASSLALGTWINVTHQCGCNRPYEL